MKEKKGTPPKSTPRVLTRTFHEILIADKRAYEPFVKVFSVEGENISKLDLGTLVGVFEVDEKDEDAAYIVNFLASVAKKEYFNNPRRGPVESFEAALHKVNVALAELVKHGNISWLGKLHGVLAVLEKNNLHFSVTGEAALLLFRQEQFSEISDGLASSEAAIHPLKTFVEVSSGRLMADDTVILATQELLALFPLDYLTKQALRMNAPDFRRFLRTALVNEIDMAAVLAIELTQANEEAVIPSIKVKNDAKSKHQPVANAFSQATFASTKTPATPVITESTPADTLATKDEFIDEKTGHIYVQGDEIEEGSSLKHSVVLESLHEMSSQVGQFFSHTLRRQGKKTARLSAFLLWESRTQIVRLTRRASQKTLTFKTFLAEKHKARAAQKVRQLEKKARQEIMRLTEVTTTPQTLPEPLAPAIPVPRVIEELISTEPPAEVVEETVTPPHIERFRSLYQRESTAPFTKSLSQKTPSHSTPAPTLSLKRNLNIQAWQQTSQQWQAAISRSVTNLAQVIFRHKKTLLFTLGGLLVIGSIGFWFLRTVSDPQTVDPQSPPPNSALTVPLTLEQNTLQPESDITLNKGLVALAFLENQGYGATSTSIVALDTKEEFPLPDIKGEIRFLAPMGDLRLLFVLTSQNELFAWSPLAKTFTKNELALPANARVTGIGTYLTYLYVLDRGNNQLYRYPRSTPGFTESTNWMKESFELTDTAYLAINETVALAPSREHLLAFSQGKTNGDFIFQNPQAPINIQALTTDNDFPFMYALGENNILSIWNLERTLLHTYTLKDAPKDALYLASDPEKSTLLVGNKEGVITRYTNVISE